MQENPKRKNLCSKKREKIYLKFNGKCSDCGKFCKSWWEFFNNKPFRFRFELIGGEGSCSRTTHEIHHTIPIELGGKDTEENLVLLCVKCHQKRHFVVGKK